MLVLDSTRLDTSQGLAELLHHRADLGVASREGHGLVGAVNLVVDFANRRDDGSGAAQAALHKGAGQGFEAAEAARQAPTVKF